jgi:hypothetical protein
MKIPKILFVMFAVFLGVLTSRAVDYAEMVTVRGGALDIFQIGKYEVTWSEWSRVRTWASANGYDIGNAGGSVGDQYPVVLLNWYHCVKWCNAKSQMEGFTPAYTVDGQVYKTGEINPECDFKANFVEVCKVRDILTVEATT